MRRVGKVKHDDEEGHRPWARRAPPVASPHASHQAVVGGCVHAAHEMRRVGQVGHDGEGGTVPGQGERRRWPAPMHLTKPSWVGALS
jgi:hypothetical protein